MMMKRFGGGSDLSVLSAGQDGTFYLGDRLMKGRWIFGCVARTGRTRSS